MSHRWGGCLLPGDMPQLPLLGAEGDKWAPKGAEGEVTAQRCPAPARGSHSGPDLPQRRLLLLVGLGSGWGGQGLGG